MVGWPSVILTQMGPSLNLTREGTLRPSLRSSLSLSLYIYIYIWNLAFAGEVTAGRVPDDVCADVVGAGMG